jgi:hypothetical protein
MQQDEVKWFYKGHKYRLLCDVHKVASIFKCKSHLWIAN